jgi:hypothetical protein
MTYRAAYLKESPVNGEMVLTAPEHRHLDDAQLMNVALANCGELQEGQEIVIGEWTDETLPDLEVEEV